MISKTFSLFIQINQFNKTPSRPNYQRLFARNLQESKLDKSPLVTN